MTVTKTAGRRLGQLQSAPEYSWSGGRSRERSGLPGHRSKGRVPLDGARPRRSPRVPGAHAAVPGGHHGVQRRAGREARRQAMGRAAVHAARLTQREPLQRRAAPPGRSIGRWWRRGPRRWRRRELRASRRWRRPGRRDRGLAPAAAPCAGSSF